MAKAKKPVFTVDWEAWHEAIGVESSSHRIYEPTNYLLCLLDRYNIKAIFYVLGVTKARNKEVYFDIIREGHVIKSHGYFHDRNEKADRKPYSFLWFTGGFWLRLLPYWFVKLNVLLFKNFYIHPHDLDLNHPELENRWLNWKRHVGLKTVKRKLERLLEEVEFEDPHRIADSKIS